MCKIELNSIEIFPCPQFAKVGALHELNYISDGVGRWLAAAVEICEYITTNGCYQNRIQHHTVGTGLAPVRKNYI